MVEVDPSGRYDTSSLKFIASAGHALTPQIVEETNGRFGPILCNVYGSTELALASTATMEEVAKDPTTGGKVASGTKLRILDEEGIEVPRGEGRRDLPDQLHRVDWLHQPEDQAKQD